ncbi:hypothetical protein HPP92_019392 [Vanilla planifolia]|uniref:Cytochrome P450 n=1 Tax=Vanilla planifolia TaxID=51239 RepID=A0A835QA80_VANPL|nr:hypothetical protein HPP92_019392 [Vanilla planifolia]
MHSLTLTRFASPAVIRSSLLPDIDLAVRRNLRSWAAAGDLHGASLLLLNQAKKITFEMAVEQLISEGPGKWTEDVRRHYNLLIDGFFSVPVPAFLSFTTYGRAIKARKKVAEALTKLVRRRKEEKDNKAQVAESRKKDMVDELLEADEGFTEEEMVDFLLALLVAGHETTPTIMTIAVKFLTENPSALALVKEEQEEIRARKKDELKPWSGAITSPCLSPNASSTKLSESPTLLAVSSVVPSPTSISKITRFQRDARCSLVPGCPPRRTLLEEARTFNPWRWMNHTNNITKDGGQQAGGAPIFTPFGGGQRLCPGYELGRVEISVFLHYLVTCFSWEVAEKDKLVFFPTTRMRNGYPIHVRRHRCL